MLIIVKVKPKSNYTELLVLAELAQYQNSDADICTFTSNFNIWLEEKVVMRHPLSYTYKVKLDSSTMPITAYLIYKSPIIDQERHVATIIDSKSILHEKSKA
jgi:hypothetical protein